MLQKIYAHRGNIDGPENPLENTVELAEKALGMGYGVELDVWFKNDCFFLGHDQPKQKVSKQYLINNNFLIHCKNYQAFRELYLNPNIHCFYHNDEPFTLTNLGKCLVHEKIVENFNHNDIVVDLNSRKITDKAYGVITDYPNLYSIKEDKIFDILILDVDGVLTNGKKTYNQEHQCISKEFCDRDFTAIKRFQSSGIAVILLTGDSFNKKMAEERNIPFIFAKELDSQLDKSKILIDFRNKILAYVGDDYYDLSLLSQVPFSFCPANAAEIVKRNCKIVLDKNGGDGIVEEIYEKFSEKIKGRYPYEPESIDCW